MDQSQLTQQLSQNIMFVQFGSLLSYLVMGFALMTIAKKENISDGWWGFIPILNLILTAKIAKQNPWLWLIALVPCVGWLIFPFMWFHVGKQRGGKEIWGALMVIPCMFLISPIVIALGD